MSGVRFEVNETAAGIVAPPKDVCKVKDCPNGRFKTRRGHAFCKTHSGLKGQMSKAKFKDVTSNNELVILPEKTGGKKKGPTSKRKIWKAIKNEILKNYTKEG